VVVVLGANAPHIDAVHQVIDAMPQTVSLALDVAAMADLVAEADLAIGAMGTSTWERCCLGLPTIAIVCADNQANVARQMEAIGAVRNLGHHTDLTGDAIAGPLIALAASPEQRAALSARALRVCDGLGAHRVAETLDGVTAPTRRDLRFRPVSPDDAGTILEWQKHPDTRRYFRNSAIPSPTEHIRWLKDRVARPDGLFEMACLHGRPVGTVRLDPRMGNDAEAAPRYEVSIVVAPEDRNAGVGGLLLGAVRRWFPEADLIAEILPGNTPSQRLFEKAGYVYDGETYYMNTGAR